MATVRDLAWSGSVPGNASIRRTDPGLTDSLLAIGASYDDDTAAAAGDIAVGQMYRNGNFLMVRLT